MNQIPPKRVNPGLQVYVMRRLFPGLRCRGRCGRYVFSGPLQPRPDMCTYRVAIHYKFGFAPKVFVLSPELAEEPPHIHNDDSLCLYHPRIFRWHDGRLIAQYIVPWSAAWLYFYEKWLDLGVWLGPEAPHDESTTKSPDVH